MKFDISENRLRAPGVKSIAEALHNNQVMTELNISGNYTGVINLANYVGEADDHMDYIFESPDMSGVTAICDAIPTMKALTKLIFGGDKVNHSDDKAPEPAVLEVGMTEADMSNKGLKAGGAIIVGAWISHKDNGALTSLNFSKNQLCVMDESGDYDASGVTALADAIGKHQ